MNEELACPICLFLAILIVCTFDWFGRMFDRFIVWLCSPKPSSPPATSYVDTDHCDSIHEDWLNGDSDEFDVDLDDDGEDESGDEELDIEENIEDLDAIVLNFHGESNEEDLLEAALKKAEGWKARLADLKGEVYVG